MKSYYLEVGFTMSHVDPLWRTSTASAGENCVEVTAFENSVLVRDTKNRDKAVLAFTSEEWQAFLVGASRGEFNLRQLRNP